MSKGISVQTMLSIALAVIFIIAIALIIQLLFPYSTKRDCMKGQRLLIEEIDSMSIDAKTTGTTYIYKFKVESCVECMWYNLNGTQDELRVRWKGMSTTDGPVIINVSTAWNIGDNNIPPAPIDEFSCDPGDAENLKGGNAYAFEIKANGIEQLSS